MATRKPTDFETVSTDINSYDTALCVIPPAESCRDIDRLRALYDKRYEKWPPHLNLVYPFVAPERLPHVKGLLQSKIKALKSDSDFRLPTVKLNAAGVFTHTNHHTIYLYEKTPDQTSLASLRDSVSAALGQSQESGQIHLTIGQSESRTDSARDFLVNMAGVLPEISFTIERLAILVREQVPGSTNLVTRMRLWDTIDICGKSGSPFTEFWISPVTATERQLEESDDTMLSDGSDDIKVADFIVRRTQSTYGFDSGIGKWAPVAPSLDEVPIPVTCSVASYNILEDSKLSFPANRYTYLCKTILSPFANSDILVLQEVSDNSLSLLLADREVRRQYPFASHGPPSQLGTAPLPSLRNVIILSKWAFSWKILTFHRRHKRAVIAQFNAVRRTDGLKSFPLIVAGVHLTCGLTDGAIAAKRVQLQTLINYLAQEFPSNPWIIAGDFNIPTSHYTIKNLANDRSISRQTQASLRRLEVMLSEAGLIDTWAVGKHSGEMNGTYVDDRSYGEEGATFDPRENDLAAATSGSSQNRPQRYDRILVRTQGFIGVQQFNMFGLPVIVDDFDHQMPVASDHWGIRAKLSIYKTEEASLLELHPINIDIGRSPLRIRLISCLIPSLAAHGMIPSEAEAHARAEAFALIKTVILGFANDEDAISSDVPMVMVPVGSYALGVWTASSDIDCLCIGSISPKTFFKLARQRIFKAATLGVRLLRKVEANTGTMLELSANGIYMDLQYCPAANIVERWYELPQLSDSDPIFNLPMLSLRKLKPLRDLNYIRKTIPNMEAFRLAYRCIKLWACQRGLYSSKFGYLGGIHITLMLSWICKRMAHQVGAVGAPAIVVAFFHHYANFNWKDEIVFDAFFHKKEPRYQRSAREPMAILGFFAPNANVAHTSSAAGLNTLVGEFRLAAQKLSSKGMTWHRFFGQPATGKNSYKLMDGAADFLASYKNFVRIDLQYWGRTLHKGTSLLGWLESRCLHLVVDISKVLPGINIRIWPARFANADKPGLETDHHGCYLIGLSKEGDIDSVLNKEERQIMKTTLQRVLERFENQLKSEEKYYDPTSSWIGVDVVKASAVKDLVLDNREWGEYVMEDDELSDDDDLENEVDEGQVPGSSARNLPIRFSAMPSQPVSANKLRPASDVLNRLRWDPNLDPSDYIIGYEDRFLGAREMGLEKWKTEQTDEEFIPQHRILYFKSRIEGKIVWERRSRIDRVFGSGVGEGESR